MLKLKKIYLTKFAAKFLKVKGQKNSDPWDIFFEKKVQLYDCSSSFSVSIGTGQKVLV